ncbi:MAG TPA: C-type lectin domain-containing protein, partial [Polyangia bacterium]|nr:C-type lectin domain-containing protein [Polyangia bacterium]
LDDYCPRERRVTNHVIVAMIADDVKQVRCTTCDADHEFKHAKVPRQRRKTETPAALYAQVLAAGPKRVPHETPAAPSAAESASAVEIDEQDSEPLEMAEPLEIAAPAMAAAAPVDDAPMAPADDAADAESEGDEDNIGNRAEDVSIHRRLIRASLPKIEGAPPPTRAIPEFTIRQPTGRPGANRFRGPRHGRGGGGGGQQFQGNRGNGFGGRGGAGANGGRGGGAGGGGNPCVAYPSAKAFTPPNDTRVHCYWTHSNSQTWSQSQQACMLQQGHLVTILSPEENDFVVSVAQFSSAFSDTWIGATDDKTGSDRSGPGTYRWVTNETWSYSNWQQGQPDGFCDPCSAGQTCTCDHRGVLASDGTWNDRWQDNGRSSVCEAP